MPNSFIENVNKLANSLPTDLTVTLMDLANADLLKVDKVVGKQLSTEDYSSAEKTKLSKLSATTPPAHVHDASEITTGNFDASRIDENLMRVFVTPDQRTAISTAESVNNKNIANGYAGLDSNGKLTVGVIPSFNTVDVFTASSQANMLLLSSAAVGDQCVRSDLPTNNVFILAQAPYTDINNWKQLNITAGVASINGVSGIVTIDKTTVGLQSVDNTSDINKPLSIAAENALELKSNLISPTFTTPNIGVATGISFNNITGLSSTAPEMDGTQTVGVGTTAARSDHVHPTDTSRQAALVSGTNLKTIGGTTLLGPGDIPVVTAISPALTGVPTINGIGVINFTKPFMGVPLFTKASVSTITIPIGTSVKAGANIITVSGTVYTLSLNSVGVGALDTGAKAAGTDYYVYALEAGGFILSANATNPTGYTTANSRQIGGFHYGVIPEAFTAINNIVAADATKIAGINAYSLWDLKFKPVCDPKGMVFILGRWYDIYLLNTDHHTYGTSAAGKTIAGGTVLHGRNFPKIPLFYGGNGTTTYGTLTWFEAAEIGKAYSKDMISYNEFVAIAYGVLEATSAGAEDTGITQHLANFTSKFGLCMATGCQYIWGKDVGNNGAASAWSTNTEGRGSLYGNAASPAAAVFGGSRDHTVESGSRSSTWNNYVWLTYWHAGCRYACDHLELA